MILIAASTLSWLGDAIETVPSSSTSIEAPVRSMMSLMVLPPGPMMSLIRSGRILMVVMRGA